MITIYTIKGCMFCIDLKVMLDEANMQYTEKDLSEPENMEEFKKIVDKTNQDSLPTILVGKSIVAPNVSFKTIAEAFKIINFILEK